LLGLQAVMTVVALVLTKLGLIKLPVKFSLSDLVGEEKKGDISRDLTEILKEVLLGSLIKLVMI
jgi:hypothetical protein